MSSGPEQLEYRVLDSRQEFQGAVFTVISDEVAMPGGRTARRDYTHHRPAVAIVALDGQERVVLLRQYRHPVRRHMWEIPAGIMDVPGEAAVDAAARELREETDLLAARWDLLVDVYSSPGHADELIRVFLARDLSPAGRTFQRQNEEADLTVHRVALTEAVAMVLRGELTNGADAVGLLAAARLRDAGWAGLRPVDTPPPGPPAGQVAAAPASPGTGAPAPARTGARNDAPKRAPRTTGTP